MKTFQKLVALLLVSIASSAVADEGAGRGPSLGLRAGYGLPFGKTRGAEGLNSGKLGDFVSGVIPLQVDAGYFFSSRFYLGASFQYGVGRLALDCQEGVSCSASQLRFGLNLAYHFQPSGALEPWVGLGVGYESLRSSSSFVLTFGGPVSTKSSVQGVEFASLQGGLDYRINDTFLVGPFVNFTAGQYWTSSSRIEVTDENPTMQDSDTSGEIENKAIHGWINGGVRMQARF